MKLNCFDKSFLSVMTGLLIFFAAGMTLDFANIAQAWKDIAYRVMVFGAVIVLVGCAVLLRNDFLESDGRGNP